MLTFGVLLRVTGRDRRVRGAFEAADEGEGNRPELPELDATGEPAEQRASLRWISAVPSAGTVAPGRPSRARRLPLTLTHSLEKICIELQVFYKTHENA